MKPLERELETYGIRPTAMRLRILEAIRAAGTACVSLESLATALDNADNSTIFRTLSLFSDRGLLHRIADGTEHTKYGYCGKRCDCDPSPRHFHFRCSSCRLTYCLKNSHTEKVPLPVGIKADSISVVLEGACTDCA